MLFRGLGCGKGSAVPPAHVPGRTSRTACVSGVRGLPLVR